MLTVLSVVPISACVAAPSPQASAASGQAIRTWNEIGSAQAAGNPIQHARVLAIMHAAQHDAVNGAVPRYQSHASNLSDPDADAEAAAVAAAHAGLVSFFPGNQSWLDARLADSLTSATYTRDKAELENAESRVMVGFHFRFLCNTGVDVGRKIGQFAIAHSLRPHPP